MNSKKAFALTALFLVMISVLSLPAYACGMDGGGKDKHTEDASGE